MTGTSTSAHLAMRRMPPKMMPPITRVRAMPLATVGTPKVSCSELATVNDCTALKPKPKVISSRIDTRMPSQRWPRPCWM